MHATLAIALTVAFAAPLEPAGAPVRTVPAEEIRQVVDAELARRLRDTGSTARIVSVDGVRDQALPAGTLAMDVGNVAGRWPRARVGVPVRLRVDGRVVRTLTVWVAMSDVRRVPTYAQAANAKSTLDAASVVVADVDMTCCDGALVDVRAGADGITGADALAGKRLRRAVRAGQPVMAADFEPMPDVAARQKVTIEVVRGPVRLTTVGVALADAHIGQRVTVRPDAAEQAVVGRVTDKQKVILDEQTP